MTFTNPGWVLIIISTVAVFWAVPARYRVGFLVSATAAFLAIIEPLSLLLLAMCAAVVYLVTRGARPTGQRAALAIVPIATALLGYKVLSVASGDDLVSQTIIPLGLSYYALRCIHYVMERYRGNIRDLGPADVVGYLFFLPTLVVGPIHRFPEWKRTVRNHRWDTPMFLEGIERLIHGYVKVGFLGNFLVSQLLVGWTESVTVEGTGPAAYLQMITIGLNLYFQFSGYSDIAIGFGLLLGHRVMENFNWPFFRRNISEFWSSWHISLTSWSREYVYTSTIAFTRSPAIGAIASLLAIALWHEVSLRYLLWGVYHGLGIVIWQWFSRTVKSWRASNTWEPGRLLGGASHAGSILAHYALRSTWVLPGATARRRGNRQFDAGLVHRLADDMKAPCP